MNEDEKNGDDYYNVRPRTKLEQQYLDQARERHLQSIVKKQIVWRKEFKGNAFIPEPKEVIFKDFEVGKSYQQKITLTNVSFTFNTFKILDLKNEIKDFFEITYKLPGKMSAGTTCDILIKFNPRINADIDDEIPFLAETGAFSIPLHCYTKKVVVSVDPSKTIDFGGVVLHEQKTITIKLENTGALDTAFRLVGEAVQLHSISSKKNNLDPKRVLRFSTKTGLLEHHSQATVTVTYLPTATGVFKSELTLKFEDKFSKDVVLTVTGEGKEVPIYLEKDEIHFQCTYINTLYRDVLVIHNRGKISMKCKLKVPKELKSHLEFVPNVGFVQTDRPFHVQLKFKPLEGILQDCEKYINKNTNEIEFPIQVQIPDQVMPVYFKLKAIITSSTLVMNPSMIEFGKCSIEETISYPITVTNTSVLPQRFGFVLLPPEIDISPMNGFAEILPKETLSFNVNFSPKAAVDYRFKLTCKTNRSEEYIISCFAVGMQPPVKLSSALMRMSAVGKGDFAAQEVILENLTKKEQEFAFWIPEMSGITIEPMFGNLSAKEKRPIQVKFTAPKKDQIQKLIDAPPNQGNSEPAAVQEESKPAPKETAAQKKKAPPPKTNTKVPATKAPAKEPEPEKKYEIIEFYKDWELSGENEPWSRHKTWSIPCFVREYELGCVYLQLQTTVVTASLIIEKDGLEINELIFGDVPIFQRIQKTVTVKNNSSNGTKLSIQAIPGNSAYSVSVPPKPFLDSGESCEMTVQFYPTEAKAYEFTFQIVSSTTNKAQLPLKGVGQSPTVLIEPPHSMLDMGDVTIGDEVSQTIQLINKSQIPIPVVIDFPETVTHPFNYDGSNPFMAVPSRLTIPVGEKASVSILYQPDHEFIHYRSICKINYGGDIHERKIVVGGRAWNPGVYVVFGDKAKAIAKGLAQELTLEDPFQLLQAKETTTTQSGAAPNIKRYRHSFENVKPGEKKMFSFELGLTKPKAGSPAKVDFAFDNLTEADVKNGFTVDAMKGTLTAGTKKEITLTFTPTKESMQMIPLPGVDVWVESTLRCIVKDTASTTEVHITLRGQILT